MILKTPEEIDGAERLCAETKAWVAELHRPRTVEERLQRTEAQS